MVLDRPGAFTISELDLAGDALASRVHDLMISSYRVEAALIGTDAIPALHETIDRMRAQPLRWLGVFTTADSLVACIAWKTVVHRNGTPILDLDRVCVDPAWFRRGLARMAIRHLIKRTRAHRITVSTGEANAPAIALYESLGFRRVGVTEPLPGLRLVEFSLTSTCASD